MSQKTEKVESIETLSPRNPNRWGLPTEAIEDLASRLRRVWLRFRPCFTTQTRDSSEYAYHYLRGLLTMDTNRNYANIARRVIAPWDDGQNLQQFMSDSPWSAKSVFEQIQQEIRNRPELNGGMLTIDESGDKRSGPQSAGTSRQYKIDLGQVGVALSYCQGGIWAMVDAELFLPEVWFKKRYAQLRKRWHIPKDRTFATKIQIGQRMIRRAKAQGLPFEIVGCDSFYGRDSTFRAALADLGLLYFADVPADTEIYVSEPVTGIPQKRSGKRGRPPKRVKVLNGVETISVRTLASQIKKKPISIRQTERGLLVYDCAARLVWTITEKGKVRKEWLFVRQESDVSFSLSNAPSDTPIERLAFFRCQRYFVERTFQDAKTEAGWDELVARKYRAFLHHTALSALALWFAAETKLDWAQQHPRDTSLATQLSVEQLPALSIANIRELLKAVLPLKQLSPEQARQLVVKHLVERSHSIRCRLKAQQRNQQSARSP